MATLDASRKKEEQEKKFFAAIAGIDLEEPVESDILENKGIFAKQEGFGINEGLGFMQQGE
jgi:hypothetical protein